MDHRFSNIKNVIHNVGRDPSRIMLLQCWRKKKQFFSAKYKGKKTRSIHMTKYYYFEKMLMDPASDVTVSVRLHVTSNHKIIVHLGRGRERRRGETKYVCRRRGPCGRAFRDRRACRLSISWHWRPKSYHRQSQRKKNRRTRGASRRSSPSATARHHRLDPPLVLAAKEREGWQTENETGGRDGVRGRASSRFTKERKKREDAT